MIEFLTANAGYVVLTCSLLIWLGIGIYLWRVENRLHELERRISR